MGLHVGQMTSQAQMKDCFNAVTVNSAKTLGLQGYGIAPGCNADMVLLQATDAIEALRTRATRLAVVRGGKLISQSPPCTARLALAGRPQSVDWRMK